tara:strand:- start:130 stop:633 length:504 start_codon:yes stop_codon:yes gene_type:complete
MEHVDYTASRADEDNSNRDMYPLNLNDKISTVDKLILDIRDGPAAHFNIDISGLYLYMTYNIDREGYYIEPHTDYPTSTLFGQIYCPVANSDNLYEKYGTAFYSPDLKVMEYGKYKSGCGYFLKPTKQSFHGLKDVITEPRYSFLLDFVTPQQLKDEDYNLKYCIQV